MIAPLHRYVMMCRSFGLGASLSTSLAWARFGVPWAGHSPVMPFVRPWGLSLLPVCWGLGVRCLDCRRPPVGL